MIGHYSDKLSPYLSSVASLRNVTTCVLFESKIENKVSTGLLASVTRDDKIWQGSKYRGIVYYHFAYHFGGKFKLYLVSLLRYGNPTCAIDWFNVPNTVKRKLSFLKTFSKIWTVYHNFNIFSLF